MTSPLQRRLRSLVSKHRRNGIFLDTNVLLLFLFAAFMPERIENSKRLAKYDASAGQLLLNVVHQFDRILTTPHVLAETINLARQNVSGRLWDELGTRLHPLICLLAPPMHAYDVDTARVPVATFVRLGLTDASIAHALPANLLLTDDLDLYLTAEMLGADAVNFTHLREAAGNL